MMRTRMNLPISLGMLLLLTVLFIPWGSRALAEEAPEVKRDVPYVPTPESVVAEMIRMAAVTDKDVLYDLGCGDGRIVVTAAKEKGARGVGVDIDPERIRESRQNAEEAGVTDRVKFIQGDLFEVDFSEATVLSMYLLPSVNMQLRPKILRDLRPGTRVVSHDFDMEDWKPDRHAKLQGHDVYFWVVPANASGTWEWRRQGGKEPIRLALQQKFQQLSGTVTSGGEKIPITDASLRGDRLRFSLPKGVDGRSAPLVFEGRINGDKVEGTAGKEPWQANRDPGTVVALDGK